jgi:osmoprotectant transport system permease protein
VLDDPFAFITYIRDNPDDFLRLLSQHVRLTLLSVLLGVAVAVPLAILATRIDRLARPLTWLAAVGQTIPSLALLGLVLPFLGIGFRPALLALTIQAFLPIFLNAYVGIRGVDRAIVDAARGMGTSDAQLLRLVELPLASPVIFAGVQTATVQNISIATLAAYIGGGGLGDLILQGLAMLNEALLLAGAVPIALLAIFAELGLGRVRRRIVPAGLRVRAGA